MLTPAPPAAGGTHPQAGGIYGTIITASVLASAGDELATWPLATAVLITLAVYWIADVYAELLATQMARERLPTWTEARGTLAATWPMVSASFIPLLVLILAWLLGASSSAAATAALAVAIVMLTLCAWAACRAAGLRGARMLAVTAIAALLGLLMVVLKNVVLVQLH
jgi:hypothetical protein